MTFLPLRPKLSSKALPPSARSCPVVLPAPLRNPPYMGSSSFNPFMSKWIKKNYPRREERPLHVLYRARF